MTQREKDLQNMREFYAGFCTELVHINTEALQQAAANMAKKEFQVPDWRLPVYPQNDDEEFVRHLLVSASINFCFSDLNTGEKFSVLWPGDAKKPWAGSTGMHAALRRAREEGIDVYDGETLGSLTATQAVRIFRSDGADLSLLENRVRNLRETGWFLKEAVSTYGSLPDCMLSLDMDAEEIVKSLCRLMPTAFGKDYFNVTGANKYRLTFDKRARLFAIMYEGRARSSGGNLPTLKNIDAIGPVIDYQIPRLLRHLNILEYSGHVANLVDNGFVIPKHTTEELAIRAAAYVATEDLNTAINERLDEAITMVEMDFLLWSEGRKAEGRHHLTPTSAY